MATEQYKESDMDQQDPRPSDSEALKGGPKADAKTLYEIVFHAEELQHNRVYYFLVAETFLMLAAATAYKVPFLVTALSASGLLTARLFTIVNLRNYWRILWLTEKLRRVCGLYDRYISFDGFDTLVKLGRFELFLANEVIYRGGTQPKRRYSTGRLFTWGLSTIITLTWLAFLLHVLCAARFPKSWFAFTLP